MERLLNQLSSETGKLSDKGMFRGSTDDLLTELSVIDDTETFMIIKVSNNTVGQQLKRTRQLLGLTGTETAEIIGVHSAVLSQIENGVMKVPAIHRYKIALFINMDLEL